MNGPPSPETTPQVREHRHDPNVEALIALLAEFFPKAFSVYEGRRRPLRIGIHHDLLAALDGAVTERELSRALGCYCSNRVYRARLRTDAVRIDLQGEPCGTVSAEHAVGDARSDESCSPARATSGAPGRCRQAER